MSVKKDLFKEARINLIDGIFDILEVYTHAHDWLDWRKYDTIEQKYKETNKPKGREIKIEWVATRDIDEYTRFEIDVKWHLIGINDVKFVQEDREIKLQKGEINIFISAYLILDYDDVWEEKRVLKFLKSFFEKYLYAGEITRLKLQLWKEAWEFYNEMKAFLHLYQYGKWTE